MCSMAELEDMILLAEDRLERWTDRLVRARTAPDLTEAVHERTDWMLVLSYLNRQRAVERNEVTVNESTAVVPVKRGPGRPRKAAAK